MPCAPKAAERGGAVSGTAGASAALRVAGFLAWDVRKTSVRAGEERPPKRLANILAMPRTAFSPAWATRPAPAAARPTSLPVVENARAGVSVTFRAVACADCGGAAVTACRVSGAG